MRRALAGLFAAGLLAGCGGKHGPAAATEPLTVEQWKALPPGTKYEIDTLERLKDGDPRLRDPREWAKFDRDVLAPARNRDAAGKN